MGSYGIPFTGNHLLGGMSGTYQTLYLLAAQVRADAASPYVRDLALRLVASCPGHEFGCEVAKIFTAVRDQITYRRDPTDQERIQDTLRTFQFRTGDCDDKVAALCGLLGSIGHYCRLVVIGQHRADSFSHIYAEVLLDGRWIPLDPTPETAGPGFEGSSLVRRTYEIWSPAGSDPASFVLLGVMLLLLSKR